MIVEWKCGKPKKNGRYVVVTRMASVYCVDYTKEYGWNTTLTAHDYPFPDEEVLVWSEDFCRAVVKLYGRKKEE